VAKAAAKARAGVAAAAAEVRDEQQKPSKDGQASSPDTAPRQIVIERE
jgi:hypothetical protein